MANTLPHATNVSIDRMAGSYTNLLGKWKWTRESQTENFALELWCKNGTRGWWCDSQTTHPASGASGGVYTEEFTVPSGITVTTVYFKVKPVSKEYDKKVGNETKKYPYWTAGWCKSNELNVIPGGGIPETPPAPTCTVSGNGDKITLEWEYSDAVATWNDVHRSVNGGSWAKVQALKHTYLEKMSWIDTNVSRGNVYRYRLRASSSDANTYSEWGDITEVATQPARPTALTATLAAVEGDTGRVDVSWSDEASSKEPKALGSAQIEYATWECWQAGSGDFQVAPVLDDWYVNAKHHVTVAGLAVQRTWYFRLRRYNDSGYSYYAYSGETTDATKDKTFTATCNVYGAARTYIGPTLTSLEAEDVTPETDETGRVRLTWEAIFVEGDTYDIQWTGAEENFPNNAVGDIQSATLDFDDSEMGKCLFTVAQLERNRTWWFRVRRHNDDGVSRWSNVASATLTPAPEAIPEETLLAPTTVTTPGSITTADTVALSWTHNSEQGTRQSRYQVYVTLYTANEGVHGGLLSIGTTETACVLDPQSIVLTDKDGEVVETLSATDGSQITWRVRTQGVDPNAWSPWSRTQRMTIWSPPVASMHVSPLEPAGSTRTGQVATGLPLTVTVSSTSSTWLSVGSNAPIAWWVSLAAYEGYDTVGRDGEEYHVADGEVVWRASADSLDDGFSQSSFTAVASASDCPLQSGETYVVRGGCVTAQGLRGEATPVEFLFRPDEDEMPEPVVALEFDPSDCTARIMPTADGENVAFDVYRLDDDGTPELIVPDVANTGDATVLDAHPSAGAQWYRVVAHSADGTSTQQRAIDQYVDCHIPQVRIDWDDEWESVDEYGDNVWYRSRHVDLPYNIRTDESYAPDVAMREYVGRRWPVSYYGTQRGQSASWQVDLMRGRDDEVVSALRRLAAWRGDCYVREPSGTGYWAHVEVSISRSYDSAAVPVRLSVRRVEAPAGGREG